VTRRLRAERSDVAVVLTSTREAVDYGAKLGASGAVGFLSKDDLSAKAFAEVLAGGRGSHASGGAPAKA
jgi:DNA-binding NarL/FixJ family response regulator